MKCVICHSEEIIVTNVNEPIQKGNDVVYVSIDVPVCKHCGERYYDKRTMLFLEDLNKKINSKKVRLKQIGKILATY